MTKKSLKPILSSAAFAIFCLVCGSHKTQAAILYAQLYDGDTYTGTGLTAFPAPSFVGTANDVYIEMTPAGNPTAYVDCGGFWNINQSGYTGNSIMHAALPAYGAPCTNIGNNGLSIYDGSGATRTIKGLSSGGQFYPYMVITDAGGGYTPGTSFISSINVSTSTNIFNVQGYFATSSASLAVYMSTENETSALQIYPQFAGGSGFTNATSSGAFNLNFRIYQQGCVSGSSTTICTTDQNYTYEATLYNGQYPYQTYPYIQSTSTSLTYPYFGTSTTFTSTFANQFYQGTVGTSTLDNTLNLLQFLNVPSLLKTKIPFAYIFQIADGIQQGIQDQNVTQIPSGTFIWSGIGTGTTTIDMFSTSTITHYLSPTIVTAWRSFLLIILTIDFAYAMYNLARNKLHI